MTPVKKNGIKLHLAVDVLGLPHMTHITAANVSDRDGAIDLFGSPKISVIILHR